MLDIDDFKSLLRRSEGDALDWKCDFPPGLLAGKASPRWEKDRGKLLKSLVALANGEGDPQAFLVYGVEDGNPRQVSGISKHWDDAEFQDWARAVFDPPPSFRYCEVSLDGKAVGVFEIRRVPRYPHVVSQDVGQVLWRGQVWFRQGSRNSVARLDDLRRMVIGHEPFVVPSSSHKDYRAVEDHYAEQGRSVRCVLINERDGLLSQGYEPAYYPGTRRELRVVLLAAPIREEHAVLVEP